MDLTQMRYFIKVAECRNITRAAQELYISQPTLSRSIAAAEEEAGVLLLDRTSRPISLTYAGQRYYETAKQILALSTDLSNQFRDISDCRIGRIILGASAQRSAHTLPAVLPRFWEKYPGVEIETLEGDAAHLEEALLHGKVDLIVFPDQTELSANDRIETVVLGPEEFVLVCAKGALSPDYLLPGHTDTVDLGKFRDQPFVLQKPGEGSRRMCNRIFQQYGFAPRVAFECDGSELTIRLAAAGVGFTMVTSKVADLHLKSVDVDLYSIADPPIQWNILAAFRKGRYKTKAEQYLLSLLVEFYQNDR